MTRENKKRLFNEKQRSEEKYKSKENKTIMTMQDKEMQYKRRQIKRG